MYQKQKNIPTIFQDRFPWDTLIPAEAAEHLTVDVSRVFPRLRPSERRDGLQLPAAVMRMSSLENE